MAHNIVKEYIDFDRKSINNYINTITEKKLNSKICEMILDIYINIRYYDSYKHIKKNTIDDIYFYVQDEFTKNFENKNNEKNLNLIKDALIIIRYVFLTEKYSKDNNISKLLVNFESKLKDEYQDSKIIISDLIKNIKSDIHSKEKFINNTASSDFSVYKMDTNLAGVYNLCFENTVKIPDLFSNIAINRVYNNGTINEDKMLVLYLLASREVLKDIVSFNYGNVYLLDFDNNLLNKRNKLNNLLKIFDNDYLKERMIIKINYKNYLDNKDSVDELIHNGYSFAIIIDSEYNDGTVLLDIFTYIIVTSEEDYPLLKKYKNVVYLK